MNIFGYELSIWRIGFISFLVCMVIFNFFLASKLEGFVSGEVNLSDPLVVCPALRKTINVHESLIEGFTASGAVVSLESSKHAIQLLNEAYSKNGCETASTA